MSAILTRIWRFLRIFLITILTMVSLQRSVLEPGDQVERVRAFTREIEFDYLSWTIDALQIKLGQYSLGLTGYITQQDQKQIVLEYFDQIAQIFELEGILHTIYSDPEVIDPELASQQIRKELDSLYEQRTHLAPLAESVLQDQLSSTVSELGLTLGGQPIPPVMYHVTPLPLALIVSPRDTIRQEANISLDPDFTIDQRVDLESKVDRSLDVSSLIVNIGGVGLYPTMVAQSTNFNWVIEVIAHEWVHNFLTLRPLGASYMSSPELRVINESTANLAGKEISAAMIERYYPQFVPPPPVEERDDPQEKSQPEPPVFDFRATMHETRINVDEMLAEGKIEEAEAYMETQRQIFIDNGYVIRKLNQAYFAFHGAYADRPGGAAGAAENPVGDAVRMLRAQSASLAEFLNRISWMWSYEQLEAAVGKG